MAHSRQISHLISTNIRAYFFCSQAFGIWHRQKHQRYCNGNDTHTPTQNNKYAIRKGEIREFRQSMREEVRNHAKCCSMRLAGGFSIRFVCVCFFFVINTKKWIMFMKFGGVVMA